MHIVFGLQLMHLMEHRIVKKKQCTYKVELMFVVKSPPPLIYNIVQLRVASLANGWFWGETHSPTVQSINA